MRSSGPPAPSRGESPGEGLAGKMLHIDCPAGIAGDMFVGAALDLGVPRSVIDSAIEKLGIGLHWRVMDAKRGSLMAKQVEVDETQPHAHSHAHAHRAYSEIRELLARLPAAIERRALGIFDRIAQVEAELHGVPIEQVSFHEVGALDSIFDIVAAAAVLDWLAPTRITCRRVPLGSGTVQTQHGLLPVPAPATVALLRGAPVESGGIAAELTTPTGAAILAASVDAWTELPPMVLQETGYGAGQRELPDRPNVLRLLTGDPLASGAGHDEVAILETNLDDMIPELCEPLQEALYRAGAIDVWFTPIYTKKHRPAFQVTALAPLAAHAAVQAALFHESTTLGIRTVSASRTLLERRIEQVETLYGTVAIKLGLEGDRVVNLAPEYESVRRRAAEHGVPAKVIYQAALAAAAQKGRD